MLTRRSRDTLAVYCNDMESSAALLVSCQTVFLSHCWLAWGSAKVESWQR